MTATPKTRYDADIRDHGFTHDPAQARAVEYTDALHQRLAAGRPSRSGWARILRPRPLTPERGLYLWGGVGRGKTYLMDTFYDSLTAGDKQRYHFDRFMRLVHQELKGLPRSPDPLPIVAARLAESMRVLCLDEFHVEDVADAMILAGLLRGLFDQGVTLVATSNIPVQALYANGLQRERFLPAIALLEQHTQVVNVHGDHDFRQALTTHDDVYQIEPADNAALVRRFVEAAGAEPRPTVLPLNHRTVQAVALGEDIAWFTFRDLCETPRSAADYVEIARRFPTVLLESVPCMGEGQNNVAQRFIQLIDALYDCSVNLFATAAAEPEALYEGRQLGFAFQRTASRLQEMRSHRYLACAHRP